jgi:hypothetical protein
VLLHTDAYCKPKSFIWGNLIVYSTIIHVPTPDPSFIKQHIKRYCMKINYALLQGAVAFLISAAGYSQVTQTELTFKPDACRGKDTHIGYINGIPSAANSNFGYLPEIVTYAWTFFSGGGSDGYNRILLDFVDLQSIPQGTTVTYAYLSLYGVANSATSPQGNQGDNASWVQRVTSAWDENTVTWNTQPGSTSTNQVAVPASTSQWNYNVIDLNITALVQDIINQPPASRNGFLIRLQNESIYRNLAFASSDNSDAARHPKLRVGLNFCSGSAARQSTTPATIIKPDQIDAAGAGDGLTATVKSNLSSNQIAVDYNLFKDGKTTLEIVSYDGTVLKSIEIDGTKGKHIRTINLDASLLKNKMAIMVIKQGNAKIANPFIIAQ